MLNHLIGESVIRARQALECNLDAAIGLNEIAVVLEEALVLDVVGQLGPLASLRERLALGDEAIRGRIASAIEQGLRCLDHPFLKSLNDHSSIDIDEILVFSILNRHQERTLRAFRTRLAQMAYECVISERVAPPLRLRLSGPLSRIEIKAQLPGRCTHAVVVGQLVGAVGEVFPLILDAYAHDLRRHGEVNVNVIGVHYDWVSGTCKAERAIFFDPITRCLWEADLEVPLAFQSCQFLCLGQNEFQLHAELSSKFKDCVQVNSHTASKRCDDKHCSAEILSRAAVPTPRATLLKCGQSQAEIRERLTAAGLCGGLDMIVQPNHGTEGLGVTAVSLDIDDELSIHEFSKQVASLMRDYPDEILVRERVSGLRCPVAQGTRAASLRINVCWDGSRYRAESAYLQIAGDVNDVVSSVGRGGRIVTLSEGAFERLGLTSDEIALVSRTACAAVESITAGSSFDDRLLLVGVDVLPERRGEGIVAWILELNPRPAGLSFSELIETHEPGVSPSLFGAIDLNPGATYDRFDTAN